MKFLDLDMPQIAKHNSVVSKKPKKYFGSKTKFGEKTYKDINFKNVRVGNYSKLPSAILQPKDIDPKDYGAM